MTKIEFGFGAEIAGDGYVLTVSTKDSGVQDILLRATALFGGCTLTKTYGQWLDPETGVTFTEEGFTLTVLVDRDSYSPGPLDSCIREVVKLIKSVLRQKAVYVTRYPVTSELY